MSTVVSGNLVLTTRCSLCISGLFHIGPEWPFLGGLYLVLSHVFGGQVCHPSLASCMTGVVVISKQIKNMHVCC